MVFNFNSVEMLKKVGIVMLYSFFTVHWLAKSRYMIWVEVYTTENLRSIWFKGA